MASQPNPQTVIEGFLLRTRRVMEHSLIREQAALMTKLNNGEVTIWVEVNTKTGEETIDYKSSSRPRRPWSRWQVGCDR